MKKFISWRRVSTHKQGKSGLGLEAQQSLINYFVEREGGTIVADYVEVYTGTHLEGCTELKKAIAHCKEIGAILVIAKSDRFRNTAEALQIYEKLGDGNIYFCDLPHTDKFTLTLFFALAEREALITSIRTKQALAAKKARGETWVRNGDTTKAVAQSAKNRVQRAKDNPINIFFWKYVTQFEEREGRIGRFENDKFQRLADELNALGQKTMTGLPYTINRCKALIGKMRKRYVEVK
jgi:DNA invertase Pin-like site-specific DNA recombinase